MGDEKEKGTHEKTTDEKTEGEMEKAKGGKTLDWWRDDVPCAKVKDDKKNGNPDDDEFLREFKRRRVFLEALEMKRCWH